jgi:hypothetical protein
VRKFSIGRLGNDARTQRHDNAGPRVNLGYYLVSHLMPDVPHLYHAQHAGGIEDAGSAGQNDAGGFEGLDEQLRDLISEKLRAWQQWIQPWECPNDGCEFGTRVVRTDERAARRARPFTIPPWGTRVVLWTLGPPAETPWTPPWRLRSRPPALC